MENIQTVNYSDWYIRKAPRKLSEVYGQEAIVKYYTKKMKSGSFDKTTAFLGNFGTGKTVMAKILAKLIACPNKDSEGNFCDSCPTCEAINSEMFNRDVEYVNSEDMSAQDIRDKVNMFMSQRGIHDAAKVMIVDEAQALSKEAVQAFLTATQAPREGFYFIFTAMDKLQGTKANALISRAKSWNMRIPTARDVYMYLAKFVQDNNLENENVPDSFWGPGLQFISQNCDDSYRKALQMLEQCYTGELYTIDEIKSVIPNADLEASTATLIDIANGRKNGRVWSFISGEKSVIDQMALYVSIVGDAALIKEYGGQDIDEDVKWRYQQAATLASAPYFDLLKEAIEVAGETPYIKKGTWRIIFSDMYKAIANGGKLEEKVIEETPSFNKPLPISRGKRQDIE